eukprot:GHRQ01024880.1.p2 GENE.GHRQ01024880.1~~GHRQ01024880.1.p2  ORF type:complete len:116 (-),score=19.23 GHRQ01024880.1:346-693(-)
MSASFLLPYGYGVGSCAPAGTTSSSSTLPPTPHHPPWVGGPCVTSPRPAAASLVRCRPPAAIEKRWTLFSSCWYLVMELKYFGTPPALRYLLFLAWRAVLLRLYEAHKALVLWRE